MPRPRPKSRLLHRPHRVVTARDESEDDSSIDFPYAQCGCDLLYYGNEPKHYVSGHEPDCSQLHTAGSKTKTEDRSIAEAAALPYLESKEERSKGGKPAIQSFREYEAKVKSLGSKRGTGSHEVFEEGKQKVKSKMQMADSRRQRKVVKRTQNTKEKAGTKKAPKSSLKLISQCSCYDKLSHPQDEIYREKARHVRHTHTDGTITFHLSTCVLNGADSTIPFKRYIDTERRMKMDKQEKRMKKLELKEHSRRQSEEAKRLLELSDSSEYMSFEEYGTHPSHDKSVTFPRTQVGEWLPISGAAGLGVVKHNPPKKASSQVKPEAYIDLEGEEEAEAAEPMSPPARRYDPMTIASDFLRVVGQHPYLPPLSSHLEGSYTKNRGRTLR